ncbi:uncharacterized protein [Pseudorasbora parva]|uniref:uncharacterized protein n=1 Tax=Pseudorasbora parva TaxID=51549 RepID=UPI00351F2CA0
MVSLFLIDQQLPKTYPQHKQLPKTYPQHKQLPKTYPQHKQLPKTYPQHKQLPKTYPQDKDIQEKSRSPDLFAEASLPCSLETPLHQVSDLLLREPQASSEEATKNYRTKVLQKLQELCENQQDILTLQRRLLAAMTVPGVETEEDILENGPCQTVEELNQFDTSLEKKETRTKMVNYLRSIGGNNPGAAVRKMLRKVATNEVLSAYSLRGKKAKLPFQDLRICSLVIGKFNSIIL